MTFVRVVSVCVLACSACSILTSLDGLSAGGVADVREASSPTDGASADVVDASTAPTDAGVDATADADSGPFCASLSPPPTFCVDFDSKPIAFDWSSMTGNNGSFTLDDAVFVSPGNSAKATLPGVSCFGPVLAKNYSTPTKEVHFEVMLRPGFDDGGVNSESSIAAFHPNAPDSTAASCAILVQQGDGFIGLSTTTTFPDGGKQGDFQFATRYPENGKWARFAVDIVADAAGHPVVSAHLDGVEIIAPRTFAACKMGGGAGFSIGVNCTKSASAQMRFDNVRFDIK
jgi:hypothetical protein